MSDPIPTQTEARYMLESPAFDASSEDFVDVVVAVFTAYAEGRVVDVAEFPTDEDVEKETET